LELFHNKLSAAYPQVAVGGDLTALRDSPGDVVPTGAGALLARL